MATSQYVNSSGNKYTLQSRPFQGGFEDFLEPKSYSQENTDISRSRCVSLLGELIFYWVDGTLQSLNPNQPTLLSLAYYPLKIVAGEWMAYVQVWAMSIMEYKYSTNPPPGTEMLGHLDSDLLTLQIWGRRHMQSMLNLRYVIKVLQNCSTLEAPQQEYTALIEDYEHISVLMHTYGNRLKRMVPVVTSMLQIADTRRSLKEAENITRLTILALLFIPLSFVTGLFSMNEGVSVHGLRLYFSVTIPLCVFVFSVSRLLPFFNMDIFWSIVRGRKGGMKEVV